ARRGEKRPPGPPAPPPLSAVGRRGRACARVAPRRGATQLPAVTGRRASGSRRGSGRGGRGVNPGAAPTPEPPGPVRRWTAWIAAGAALLALGAWALLVRAALTADDDPGIPPVEVLVGALWFGWPYGRSEGRGGGK